MWTRSSESWRRSCSAVSSLLRYELFPFCACYIRDSLSEQLQHSRVSEWHWSFLHLTPHVGVLSWSLGPWVIWTSYGGIWKGPPHICRLEYIAIVYGVLHLFLVIWNKKTQKGIRKILDMFKYFHHVDTEHPFMTIISWKKQEAIHAPHLDPIGVYRAPFENHWNRRALRDRNPCIAWLVTLWPYCFKMYWDQIHLHHYLDLHHISPVHRYWYSS